MKKLEAGMVCVITGCSYCTENLGREVTLMRLVHNGEEVPEIVGKYTHTNPKWLVTAEKLQSSYTWFGKTAVEIIDFTLCKPEHLTPITPDNKLTEQFESEMLEDVLEFVK